VNVFEDGLAISIFGAIMLTVATGIVFINMHQPHTVRYDCSISENSPDFPIEVKEACRKLKRNIT